MRCGSAACSGGPGDEPLERIVVAVDPPVTGAAEVGRLRHRRRGADGGGRGGAGGSDAAAGAPDGLGAAGGGGVSAAMGRTASWPRSTRAATW